MLGQGALLPGGKPSMLETATHSTVLLLWRVLKKTRYAKTLLVGIETLSGESAPEYSSRL